MPANNILVTHSTDLMTTLHSGSVHTAGPGAHTFADEMLELISATAAGSGGLKDPQTLLAMTGSGTSTPTVGISTRYNEVIVCGKPGVPLPWGVTGELKVLSMFMFITKKGVLLGTFDAETRLTAMKNHSKSLNCPLLFLPNGGLNLSDCSARSRSEHRAGCHDKSFVPVAGRRGNIFLDSLFHRTLDTLWPGGQIIVNHIPTNAETDDSQIIDRASEESFPASDPPDWIGVKVA